MAIVEGSIFEFKTYDRQDNLIIEYNDEVISIDSSYNPGNPLAEITINGEDYNFKIERIINGYNISGYGFSSDIIILSKRAHELSKYMLEKDNRSNLFVFDSLLHLKPVYHTLVFQPYKQVQKH